MSALIFGRDVEGDAVCEWPPRIVGWSGPTTYANEWHRTCPLPPAICEWNYGEDDACQLAQAYEWGAYCVFHSEVELMRTARDYYK